MPRPIVIASVMREQGTTGVQTHVRAVHDWLRQQGRAVRLVTPFDQPAWQVYPVFGLRRLLERLSQTASVWWYRHWHPVFLQRALQRTLRDGQACTIYAQCPPSAQAALRARVSPAQRVVMVVHFNLSQAEEWADKGAIPRGGRLFRAIERLEADVLPRLDGVAFVSDFMRQELLRRIPELGRVPCQVVHNFVPDPGPVARPAELRDLVTIGTLEYRKNQGYALDILHAAKQLGTRLTLTLVGDGPDRPKLEARVAELGLSDQVHMTGYVPQAAALMAGHRACLHVARMESFGIVLIEAMSRGLPVFATAAGGMPEVFGDGEQGRLLPLDDAPTAARLLLDWMNDASTLQRAGDAARVRFLEHFEADRTASRLLGFLDKVGAA